MDLSLLAVSVALIAWLVWELRGQDLQLFFDPNAQLAFWTYQSTESATPAAEVKPDRERPMQRVS